MLLQYHASKWAGGIESGSPGRGQLVKRDTKDRPWWATTHACQKRALQQANQLLVFKLRVFAKKSGWYSKLYQSYRISQRQILAVFRVWISCDANPAHITPPPRRRVRISTSRQLRNYRCSIPVRANLIHNSGKARTRSNKYEVATMNQGIKFCTNLRWNMRFDWQLPVGVFNKVSSKWLQFWIMLSPLNPDEATDNDNNPGWAVLCGRPLVNNC